MLRSRLSRPKSRTPPRSASTTDCSPRRAPRRATPLATVATPSVAPLRSGTDPDRAPARPRRNDSDRNNLGGTPMPVNSIARTVLRFQYSLVRSPLTALDAQLLGRLSDSSRVKMTLTRGLAGLDVAAGRLMNDPQLERRGDVAAERTAKTERAMQAEAKADAL